MTRSQQDEEDEMDTCDTLLFIDVLYLMDHIMLILLGGM